MNIDIGFCNKDIVVMQILPDDQFQCRCVDCLNEIILNKEQLQNTRRKTFFCQCKVEKMNKLKFDLRGQIFGDLLVEDIDIQKTNDSKDKYGKRIVQWKTICQKCGNCSSHSITELKKFQSKNTSGCVKCHGKNLIGQKFNRLQVLEKVETDIYQPTKYLCLCDCGNTVVVDQSSLLNNNTRSCGCLHKELLVKRNKEQAKLNGDSVNPLYRRIHQIWSGMKARCYSPNHTYYNLYGEKGICICDEWLEWENFKSWALSNGYSDDLTIDRIDGDKDYCPENCRWVTYKEQANNVSSNKILTYKGKTKTLSQWCDELFLNYSRTKARINNCNYTIEEAFELGKYEKRKKGSLCQD